MTLRDGTLSIGLFLCSSLLSFFFNPGLKGQDREEKLIKEVDSLNREATRHRFRASDQARDLARSAYQVAKKEAYYEGMARAMDLMAETSFFQNDPVSGRKWIQKADSLRSYVQDRDPEGKGERSMELGIILQNKHAYDRSDSLFQRALGHYEKAGDISGMAKAQYFRSLGQFYRNRYPKALQDAHRALELYDSTGITEGRAKSHYQIGRIHKKQGKKKEAQRSFEKAIELFKESENANGLANAHDLLGQHFLDLGRIDSARYHYRRSIGFYEKGGDEKGKAYGKAHLAKLFLRTGKRDSSEKLTRKALKVFREFRDPTGLIMGYERMGTIHRKRGALDSALFYFQKALPHARSIKSFEEQASLFESIAEIRDRKGKGDKAYDALKKASRFEDSLALREQKKKMAELEARYEMRERKKELRIKEAELQQKAVQQYALLGGIGLILIFSGFLYAQYRRKKKANIALKEKNELIEEKNQEILQSLDYASKIQHAVLPDETTIDSYFSSGFVFFKPRDKVSGDLYWMEAYEGRFYLAVVDCTGHGVPGAMISILGHNGLNEAIMEKKLKDPADILRHLDGEMKNTLGQRKGGKELRDGMDVALCAYDPEERSLSFAGAIEPLYLLRNGSDHIEEIKGDRQAIGGIVEESDRPKRFTSHRIQLQQGDRIYIFSDGYPDQFGGKKGKKLKHKAFQNILLEKKDLDEFAEQESHLDQRFEEWRGDHEQVDDVLVIGAEV